MQTYYYNLSGGINFSSTKTELGLDTKNIFWSDSENVEILQNRGVIRQKGNVKLLTLPSNEEILALQELKYGSNMVVRTRIMHSSGQYVKVNKDNLKVNRNGNYNAIPFYFGEFSCIVPLALTIFARRITVLYVHCSSNSAAIYRYF